MGPRGKSSLSSKEAGLLLTFPSVHAALATEERLKAAGLALEMIPLPREISSACGYGILLGPGAGAEAWIKSVDLEASYKVYETEPEDGSRRRRYYERENAQP